MLTTIFELAGLTCLVVAGALVSPALAFLVAGVGFIGKAFEVEATARKAQRRRAR